MNNKDLGKQGENIAKNYLLKKGYLYLAQNYKSSYQEIDLIFSFNKKIIFIEVKTRIKNQESVVENPLTKSQTNNLKLAIINYCLKNKINLDNIRLDLIVILVDKNNHQADLKHCPDIL